ncbi:hypothetical protein BCR44DRAFT_1043334 [Catenaria anguillulae PL171]|uniref:Uncharacterized protein n=1 Tax=Catenaria anguillulae PL171 TaxID=765915 RepID=A0A1Y2HRS6_9FUNG|nr:hypothetical protein BCR44DRAFT_1043334 [Catenaria anguillulae PL171]
MSSWSFWRASQWACFQTTLEQPDGSCVKPTTDEAKWIETRRRLRALARDHGAARIAPILIGLWADEASGTLSKRSAHFETWQFHVANLPAHLNQHPTIIQFIAAAKNVECLDIANAAVHDIQSELKKGLVCVPPNGETAIMVGTASYFMGDGPKHSQPRRHPLHLFLPHVRA